MEKKKSTLMGKIITVTIIVILLSMMGYYALGIFGLLPKYFYEQCKDIDKETAMKRGCCEDRGEYEPTSLLFGKDNCDRHDKNKSKS